MRRLLFTLILAATTMACSNFGVAASKCSNTSSKADAAASLNSSTGPTMPTVENPSDGENQLSPRLEYADWRTALVCATPVGSCLMVVYSPIGSSCYCQVGPDIVWGVVELQ